MVDRCLHARTLDLPTCLYVWLDWHVLHGMTPLPLACTWPLQLHVQVRLLGPKHLRRRRRCWPRAGTVVVCCGCCTGMLPAGVADLQCLEPAPVPPLAARGLQKGCDGS